MTDSDSSDWSKLPCLQSLLRLQPSTLQCKGCMPSTYGWCTETSIVLVCACEVVLKSLMIPADDLMPAGGRCK